MQGTSLDEVFSNFGSPVDFQGASFPPLFGIRSTPQIPLRDASGSTLYQITQEQLLQSLSEDIPVLDKNILEMKSTVDDYRNLRNYNKYLLDEVIVVEKNIKDLEELQGRTSQTIVDYTNAVLRNGILTKEEYSALQGKLEELRLLQRQATEKCLNEYKKHAMDLHAKLQKVSTQLTAYSEFIKTGVKEMVGPDVKPNSCSVCFEKEITHCFVPCGHTFCEGCIKQSDAKKCMSCRQEIQKTIKIFLGV